MTDVSLNAGRILVDTDVFSYLYRGDTRAEFFRPYLRNKTLAVSFMTVAELYFGAYKRNWESAISEIWKTRSETML